ncbi:MAG: glycosyltransferase family 2 protein [Candidatus Latescibacteria bacterium]|nr:glycosyltransferase family 2 protein [Candidatus Latescibacterota bacterium]
MKKISVIIPLYNERDSLEELFGLIVKALESMNAPGEIIFIDDGSTDGSYDELTKIRDKDPEVKIIRFMANSGKAAALQAGFDVAEGDYIITMDADLQDDPAEIPKLVAALESGYDMVSGWKKHRHDPLSKTLPSKVFNSAVRFISGLKLHDFNCGLKAYRREVVKSLSIYGELHRYIPVLAKFNGYRVGEITVQHHPRKYGRSKYGIKRFISGFLDLLTVILLTKYTSKPLHLFGSVGIVFCFLGGLVNLHVVIIFIKNNFQGISGRVPYLVGGIFLFLLGVQFISTGLLAELITHSRMEKEKTYHIDSASST